MSILANLNSNLIKEPVNDHLRLRVNDPDLVVCLPLIGNTLRDIGPNNLQVSDFQDITSLEIDGKRGIYFDSSSPSYIDYGVIKGPGSIIKNQYEKTVLFEYYNTDYSTRRRRPFRLDGHYNAFLDPLSGENESFYLAAAGVVGSKVQPSVSQSSTYFSEAGWKLFAWVQDSSQSEIFINNQTHNLSTESPQQFGTTTSPYLMIGANDSSGTTQPWDGYIRNFRIYHRKLSREEIGRFVVNPFWDCENAGSYRIIATSQSHNLNANDITTTPVVGNPALTQTHELTASDLVSSAPTVGNPTLGETYNLNANDITVSPTVDNPALTQDHTLTANSITTTPVVGNPVISSSYSLNADDLILNAPIVDNPALTQDHQLSANSLLVSPLVSSPVLTQDHTLAASSISTTPVVGNPTLSVDGTHYLNADNLVVSPSVGSPTLTMTHSLSADDLTIISIVGAPALTQDHTLTADGLTVAVQVGNPVLNGNVLKPKSYLVTGQNYSYKIIAENKLIKVIGYDL